MKLYYHALEAAAESWDIVKALPNYQILVGELLFRQIFELAPSAISLYPFGHDGTQNIVPELVYTMPSFIRHAESVVGTLEVALTMRLGDDMHDLALTLQQLGARHLEYGVLPLHYRIVETALIRTLETGLKERWSEELRKGWQAVFKFLAKAMMCGCECELQIVKEERSIKERRIKLHTSPKREVRIELGRSTALAKKFDNPRWNPTGYIEPFRKSIDVIESPEMSLTRKSSFDTSPKLPTRSSHINDEDEDNAEEAEVAGSFLARCSSDSVLPHPLRCHSPERVDTPPLTNDPAG